MEKIRLLNVTNTHLYDFIKKLIESSRTSKPLSDFDKFVITNDSDIKTFLYEKLKYYQSKSDDFLSIYAIELAGEIDKTKSTNRRWLINIFINFLLSLNIEEKYIPNKKLKRRSNVNKK